MAESPDDPPLTPLQVEERPAVAVEPGTRLGKYELVKRLSVGGMAEIFLARASGLPGFQKLVVVKRILPQLASKPDFVDMFLNEARLAATLHHPNVVLTHDVCVINDNYLIVMEYLHGEDVRTILRTALKAGRRLPLEQVLQIGMALCSGLHYAHEKDDFDGKPLNIVHCDVSPGNVIVTFEGGIKLLDFGIARAAIRAHETRTGQIEGKLGYMSPEQARAEEVDRRTDVFAAGVILYELSVGRKLYKGNTDYEILHQVIEGKVVPPSKIDPAYDPELEKIVMRAIDRQPNKRYQTASDLQMALEAFARQRKLFLSPTGLKTLMSDLFGRKLDAWREAQREGKSLLEVVANYEDEDDASLPPPATSAPQRRWLRPAAAAAAAGLALLLGVGIALRRQHHATPLPVVQAPVAPTTPLVHAPVAPTTPVAHAEALPPASPPASGTVKIVTHPHDAHLMLDGVPTSKRSPALFEHVAADRDHQVSAQLDGYAEAKKTFSVVKNRSITVMLALAKTSAPSRRGAPPAAANPSVAATPSATPGEGTLAIATNPWCNVAVDGVDHGQTPIDIKLPAGRHTLTLTNPDFHIKRQLSVTITSNETVRKKLDFSQ